MGDYFQLIFHADLIIDDENVKSRNAIKFIARRSSGNLAGQCCPEHKFFSHHNWESLASRTSHYCQGTCCAGLDRHTEQNFKVSIMCNTKDRDLIVDFLDWVSPFVENKFIEFLGTVKWDFQDRPLLLYHDGTKIVHIPPRELDDFIKEQEAQDDPHG